MNEPISAIWVVGSFDGEAAKSVQAHADAGIGYIILDSAGRGQSSTVVAAFRRAEDSPLPPHLEEVRDPAKIDKYEKIRKQR